MIGNSKALSFLHVDLYPHCAVKVTSTDVPPGDPGDAAGPKLGKA